MAEPQFSYVALKRMKVHELDADGQPVPPGENGRPVMRQLQPGDPIPEAVHWKNLWREVRAGRVGMAGTPLSGPALADSLRRRNAGTAEAKAVRRRARRSMTAAQAAEARATGTAPELEPEKEPDQVELPTEAQAETEPELQAEDPKQAPKRGAGGKFVKRAESDPEEVRVEE